MTQSRTSRAILSIAILILAAGYFALERQSRSPRESLPAPQADSASSFDYYLVALSWSPTWCASNPDDKEQCGRRGYGFILHGLWPQYENADSPKDCAIGDDPDEATIARTLAFMPSRRLIEHEWRKHGTCSGLDSTAYFALADRAYAAIRIPQQLNAPMQPVAMNAEEVRSAFVSANPGMQADMLSVKCSARDLAEVRICVDFNLVPRSCGQGVKMQCPRDTTLHIPLVR